MKLAGKLSIARRTSNMEPEYFVIEIEDAASGTEAVSVRVSPADLALAISGRANVPVEVEWRVDNVGKRAETKTEIVRCKIGATDRAKRAAAAVFEVDGWRADLEDLGNGHRATGDGGYRVTFRRWVKVADATPAGGA